MVFAAIGSMVFICNQAEAKKLISPWASITLPGQPPYIKGGDDIEVKWTLNFNHGSPSRLGNYTKYKTPWSAANPPPAVPYDTDLQKWLSAIAKTNGKQVAPETRLDDNLHESIADFSHIFAEIPASTLEGDLLGNLPEAYLMAQATLTPKCRQNPDDKKCGQINASAGISTKGVKPTTAVIEGGEVTRGTGVGDPPDFGFTATYFLNLSNEEDPASYQQAYSITLDSDPLINAVVADISLGPLSGQPRIFDIELNYGGNSCLITATSPDCSPSFVANLVAGIINPSKWSFDPSTSLWYANQDLSLPSAIALNPLNHADATGVAYYQLGLAGGANDLEVSGPLPIFGAMTAFGWSRRLRKRIESS